MEQDTNERFLTMKSGLKQQGLLFKRWTLVSNHPLHLKVLSRDIELQAAAVVLIGKGTHL